MAQPTNLAVATSKALSAYKKIKETLKPEEEAPILKVLADATATEDSQGNAKKPSNTVVFDLMETAKAFLLMLLEEQLSPPQKKLIAFYTAGSSKDILASVCANPKDVYNAFNGLGKADAELPNAEFKLGGRWYPVHVNSEYNPPSEWGGACTNLAFGYKVCDKQDQEHYWIGESFFEDDENKPVQMTFGQVLEKVKLRPFQTDIQEFMKSVRAAERAQAQIGKVFNAVNSGLMYTENGWWSRGLQEVEVGSPICPRKIIVEGELEAGSDNNPGYGYGRQRNTNQISLPFVRVFCLEMKKYVYLDVGDLEEYGWDENAISRLVLPGKMEVILKQIFTSQERLFGDVVAGKHGGMVLMANGPTGVGKTLTAEIFAEHTKRPLYVMEMGELGTNLKDVEQNLQRIFVRAARWRAILLFDEADVFMARRDTNLERSAIVGVFLRLLDYYQGLMFLTTNRAEVIDPAFRSRITLQLDYPKLNAASRRRVWETMLRAAGYVDEQGKLAIDLDGLPDLDLNGREIRNVVRLIKVLHPKEVTAEQVKEITTFSASAQEVK